MPSIYTCTMNLAIDLFIETEHLEDGKVNRTLSDDIQANGKGVNVSLIMKQLGIDSTALGFAAGFTGKFISDTLASEEIATDFVEVEGFTRINVFTKVNATGEEFKQVNKGPVVGQSAQKQLLQKINNLQSGDYLIVSGSLPRGVDSSILVNIAQVAHRNKVHLVFDVSDSTILDCLRYQPYLLKPNEEEIAKWFGCDSVSVDEAIFYAKELIHRGAQHVLLSLGENGAVFIDNDLSVYRCTSPKGEVVNTACAGDTLLGTFLACWMLGEKVADALIKGVAAGASTAFRSGITDFSDVATLEKQIILY
ncbi:1-phosphofructokinase [Streptococcus suis]|uniref:1-phosphofructokinase n=1 Tax=Streptococcus suis TaxID=1307 RepID=UPI0037069837